MLKLLLHGVRALGSIQVSRDVPPLPSPPLPYPTLPYPTLPYPTLGLNPNPEPAPTQTLDLTQGRVGTSPETWIDQGTPPPPPPQPANQQRSVRYSFQPQGGALSLAILVSQCFSPWHTFGRLDMCPWSPSI